MIQNLTKESFWNELEKKFPAAVKLFCEWIDKYKAEVGWDWLFQLQPGMSQSLKFHHVPIEMQVGIMGRFIVEQMNFGNPKAYEKSAGQEYHDYLNDFFRDVESDIKNREAAVN